MQNTTSSKLDLREPMSFHQNIKRDANRKLYTRKRKNPLESSASVFPTLQGEYSSLYTDAIMDTTTRDDCNIHCIEIPFAPGLGLYGRIPYCDDDTKMNTTYDPEQDRNLKCYVYQDPTLVISNIRSLNKKARPDNEISTNWIFGPSTQHSNFLILKQEADPLPAIPAAMAVATTNETASKTETIIPRQQQQGNPSTFLQKSFPVKVIARNHGSLKHVMIVNPTSNVRMHAIHDANGNTWKPPQIDYSPPLGVSAPCKTTVPVAPLETVIKQEPIDDVDDQYYQNQHSVPISKQIDTKRIHNTYPTLDMIKHPHMTAGIQPVALKNIKLTVINPSKVQVGITHHQPVVKQGCTINQGNISNCKQNPMLQRIDVVSPGKMQEETPQLQSVDTQGHPTPVGNESNPTQIPELTAKQPNERIIVLHPRSRQVGESPMRIKVLNPENINVGMEEILRHLQTARWGNGKTGELPAKMLCPIGELTSVVEPASSSVDQVTETKSTSNIMATFVVKKVNMSAMSKLCPRSGSQIIRLRPLGAAAGSASNSTTKKLVDTKILKSALNMARKTKTIPTTKKPVDTNILRSALSVARKTQTIPRKQREPYRSASPEFEPGSENLSFLYLKVEDPYPDEHGRLVEPSMSLIERSLNQTSLKAEDTTTWSTKNLNALGTVGETLKKPQIAEVKELPIEVTEAQRERSPSPNWLADHSYNRPATPDNKSEESGDELAQETIQEVPPEESELDKVYTAACNYQPRQKKFSNLCPPLDMYDEEKVIIYLQKKLEYVNEENKALESELRKARKLIGLLRDRVFQFKLARGMALKVKKKRKTTPAPAKVTESNDDFFS